jgi:hypothetical protein
MKKIATATIAAITAWALMKSAKRAYAKRRKTMPSDRVPVGDILILRSGLQNIAEDAQRLLARRKQARVLMRLLDELLERREKEAGDL